MLVGAKHIGAWPKNIYYLKLKWLVYIRTWWKLPSLCLHQSNGFKFVGCSEQVHTSGRNRLRCTHSRTSPDPFPQRESESHPCPQAAAVTVTGRHAVGLGKTWSPASVLWQTDSSFINIIPLTPSQRQRIQALPHNTGLPLQHCGGANTPTQTDTST